MSAPLNWEPTSEYRTSPEDGKLERKFVAVVWPNEPYREKGEEIIHEKWEHV